MCCYFDQHELYIFYIKNYIFCLFENKSNLYLWCLSNQLSGLDFTRLKQLNKSCYQEDISRFIDKKGWQLGHK